MTTIEAIPATGPILVDGPIDDPLGLFVAAEAAAAAAAPPPPPAEDRPDLVLRIDERLTAGVFIDYTNNRGASALIALFTAYAGVEAGALDEYGADELHALEILLWKGLHGYAQTQALPFALRPCKLRDIAALEDARWTPEALITWFEQHSALAREDLLQQPAYLVTSEVVGVVGRALGLDYLR